MTQKSEILLYSHTSFSDRIRLVLSQMERTSFDQIPVRHSYENNGEQTPNLPFGIEPDEVSPVFTDHKGWEEDLTGRIARRRLSVHSKLSHAEG